MSPKSKQNFFIGVDVGGTYIKAVLINRSGQVISSRFVPTVRNNKNKIIQDIIALIDFLDNKAVGGIGVGLPGKLNKEASRILRLVNLPVLEKVNLKNILTSRFKCPVLLENDANCFAWGQWYFYYKNNLSSRLRTRKNLAVFTLGTGVGGGLVLAGQLYKGRAGAGEFGHMVVESQGFKCSCGSYGCLEEYISVRAIERTARKLGLKYQDSVAGIYQLAKQKNKKAIQVLEITASYLALGIINISRIFDPEIIVIGGGIAKSGNFLLPLAKKEMQRRNFSGNKLPKIVLVKDNDNAGAIGAAALHLRK